VLDVPPAIDPGDALSQPTRRDLFRLLGELGKAASTRELAEELGLHPNGVRIHLDRLERDGLVSRASEPRPRGRPRDLWSISPGARPGGGPPRAYRDLARWLSRAITAGQPSLASLEATGREIGRELAPAGPGSDENPIVASFAALGFQPRVAASDDDSLSVCFENCPYSDAAAENQSAICTLHRGITSGLLEVLVPHAHLATFEPRDPVLAGCTVEITGMLVTADGR
jgi:predicted ArsR family transcriptional regulator